MVNEKGSDMKTVIKQVLKGALGPVARRLGTAFAAYLLAQDIQPEITDQLLTALGVVAGLSLDIALSLWRDKERAVR